MNSKRKRQTKADAAMWAAVQRNSRLPAREHARAAEFWKRRCTGELSWSDWAGKIRLVNMGVTHDEIQY